MKAQMTPMTRAVLIDSLAADLMNTENEVVVKLEEIDDNEYMAKKFGEWIYPMANRPSSFIFLFRCEINRLQKTVFQNNNEPYNSSTSSYKSFIATWRVICFLYNRQIVSTLIYLTFDGRHYVIYNLLKCLQRSGAKTIGVDHFNRWLLLTTWSASINSSQT